MSETPKKSDKQSKRDARLKTFLRRAGPVIAAERGLTSTARIKLQTIAAEMRSKGIDIVNFSVGEPDFNTTINIINAG